MCPTQAPEFCISSNSLFKSNKIHVITYNICQRSLNEGKGGRAGMRRTFVQDHLLILHSLVSVTLR